MGTEWARVERLSHFHKRKSKQNAREPGESSSSFAPFSPKRNRSNCKKHWQETKGFITKALWRTLQRDYAAQRMARPLFRILPDLSSSKFHTITTAPQALPFFSFFPNSWPPKLCQLPSLLSVAALPEWGWKEIPPGLSSLLLRSIRLPLPSLQRLLRTKPGEEEKQCIFTCEYFCPVACLKKKKKVGRKDTRMLTGRCQESFGIR